MERSRSPGDQGRCVATLLDTRDTQAPAGGPAYVLTAGQCANLKSGEIRKDTKVVGYVSFNFFADTLEQIKSYPLKSLRWSSGYGSDLAIIELDVSLAALIAEGIQPPVRRRKQLRKFQHVSDSML